MTLNYIIAYCSMLFLSHLLIFFGSAYLRQFLVFVYIHFSFSVPTTLSHSLLLFSSLSSNLIFSSLPLFFFFLPLFFSLLIISLYYFNLFAALLPFFEENEIHLLKMDETSESYEASLPPSLSRSLTLTLSQNSTGHDMDKGEGRRNDKSDSTYESDIVRSTDDIQR